MAHAFADGRAQLVCMQRLTCACFFLTGIAIIRVGTVNGHSYHPIRYPYTYPHTCIYTYTYTLFSYLYLYV